LAVADEVDRLADLRLTWHRSITGTAVYTALARNRFEASSGMIGEAGSDRGGSRMGRKTGEDDSTKDFKKAVKAVAKPSKKEEKRIDKITKHLPKKEKI
jgi:hypothetical protein